MVADRIIFRDAANTGLGQSIWADAEGSWEGSIAWNDNHVAYETDQSTVEWKIDAYTGRGLIPPAFDDPINLPFVATAFLYQ